VLLQAFGLTWNEYMGMCSLPAHVGIGGRPYIDSKKEYYRTLAKNNTTICSKEETEACSKEHKEACALQQRRTSATGLAEEGVKEEGEGEGEEGGEEEEEEEERERRGKSLEVLWKMEE
jgi:hypothetical protein